MFFPPVLFQRFGSWGVSWHEITFTQAVSRRAPTSTAVYPRRRSLVKTGGGAAPRGPNPVVKSHRSNTDGAWRRCHVPLGACFWSKIMKKNPVRKKNFYGEWTQNSRTRQKNFWSDKSWCNENFFPDPPAKLQNFKKVGVRQIFVRPSKNICRRAVAYCFQTRATASSKRTRRRRRRVFVFCPIHTPTRHHHVRGKGWQKVVPRPATFPLWQQTRCPKRGATSKRTRKTPETPKKE